MEDTKEFVESQHKDNYVVGQAVCGCGGMNFEVLFNYEQEEGTSGCHEDMFLKCGDCEEILDDWNIETL